MVRFQSNNIAKLSSSRQLQSQLDWDTIKFTIEPPPDPTPSRKVTRCSSRLAFATFEGTRGLLRLSVKLEYKDDLKYEDSLKYEENLNYEDNLKYEYDLQYEDDLEYEDNLQYEDDLN